MHIERRNASSSYWKLNVTATEKPSLTLPLLPAPSLFLLKDGRRAVSFKRQDEASYNVINRWAAEMRSKGIRRLSSYRLYIGVG